jgi:hypothetical protein
MSNPFPPENTRPAESSLLPENSLPAESLPLPENSLSSGNPFPANPDSFESFPMPEVFVARARPRRRYWLHGLLLLATLCTTTLVGVRLNYNFQHDLPAFSMQSNTLPLFPLLWVAEEPARILLGLPFSVTLLLILMAHEMGHFLIALHYGVDATLPHFIPAPTLIGTLGAFIKIRSPIRSRAALFDIGSGGPFAGFALAFPVLVLAMTLSKPAASAWKGSDVVLGYPLVFHGVHWLLGVMGSGVGKVKLDHVLLHPMAIAAWVGMFATSLNLLPGGQLDGGHIVYAAVPRLYRHIGRMTVSALFTMGLIGVLQQMGRLTEEWRGWPGWMLWAVVVLVMGRKHPPVAEHPGLDRRRQWLALAALALFVITFMPVPLFER